MNAASWTQPHRRSLTGEESTWCGRLDRMPQRVVVVGAGVVGLTCAVRLLEAGHRVDVLARDLPLETTSSVAAAIWYPYLAFPQDQVTAWGKATYDELARQAAQGVDGVVMRRGTELLRERTADPWWIGAVPALERVEPREPYADAWSFATPVVEMPRYLTWLTERVRDAGGTITRMALARLPDAPLVVNCAGLGSRVLAGDPSTTPVRGQVVIVEQVGLDEWWLAEEGPTDDVPTYVIPRADDIVLGGTDDAGEWSRTPDPVAADAILRRAAWLVPEVAGARVLRHRVGLRPARPEVRLERVGDVIHCYGHGGAGVTLSWSCADDVRTLAEK
jgi:D-amino-acid oxidase